MYVCVCYTVAGRTSAAEERAVLIGVWGNHCELMTLVLWSAAAVPHTDSDSLTLTSPVCAPPQGETDPEGTFSVSSDLVTDGQTAVRDHTGGRPSGESFVSWPSDYLNIRMLLVISKYTRPAK